MKRLLALLFLSPLTVSAFQWAGPLPSDLSKECLDYIKAMPPELEYDFIQVPEDWDHPETSPKLHIFYYTPKLHELEKLNITPIAYYNGGPGSPSHNIYEYFKKYTPLAEGVPFLYIDQRGTGCSSLYPEVPVTLEGAKRIGLYGTRNIVRDSEAIRKHLFKDHRKWRIFGQSFGGYIVHRYIQIAPEAIEKAYAHGASLMTDGIAWGMARMASQKRNGEAYDVKYPGDKEILAKARALFPKDYCNGNATVVSCGSGLLDYFGWSMLGFSNSWGNLHKAIGSLLKADGSFNLEYMQSQIPNQVDAKPSMIDFMVAVIPGRELPAGFLNTWSCKKATERFKAQGENPDEWQFNECRLSINAQATYDSFLDQIVEEDYLTPKMVAKSLKRNPKLDFYLYSGQLDSIVPVESFGEEVKWLRNRIHYTNFLQTGHNWMAEAQIWSELKLP